MERKAVVSLLFFGSLVVDCQLWWRHLLLNKRTIFLDHCGHTYLRSFERAAWQLQSVHSQCNRGWHLQHRRDMVRGFRHDFEHRTSVNLLANAPASGSDVMRGRFHTESDEITARPESRLRCCCSPCVTNITVGVSAASTSNNANGKVRLANVRGQVLSVPRFRGAQPGGALGSAGVFTPSGGAGTGTCTANSTQAGSTDVSGSATIAITSGGAPPPVSVGGSSVVATPSSIAMGQTTTCVATVTGTEPRPRFRGPQPVALSRRRASLPLLVQGTRRCTATSARWELHQCLRDCQHCRIGRLLHGDEGLCDRIAFVDHHRTDLNLRGNRDWHRSLQQRSCVDRDGRRHHPGRRLHAFQHGIPEPARRLQRNPATPMSQGQPTSLLRMPRPRSPASVWLPIRLQSRRAKPQPARRL